jgi:hypothetical protein
VVKINQPSGLVSKKISVNFTSLNVLYSTENVQVEKPGKILKLIRGYTISERAGMIPSLQGGQRLIRLRN